LTSETNATNILAASKALRQSDDSYIARNVYFNPDLNPIEAKLAYERRKQICQRCQHAATKQTVVKHITSLSVDAETFAACSTDVKTASSSAANGVQHIEDLPSQGSTSSSPTNHRQLVAFSPVARLTCYLLNAQSVANKLQELHYMLYSYKPSLLFVTESWLNENVLSGCLDPKSRFYVMR